MSETIILWDHPPHNPKAWVADVSGLGRYLIKREPRQREFTLFLNGVRTKYRGTPDELKAIVRRIVDSRDPPVVTRDNAEEQFAEMHLKTEIEAGRAWIVERIENYERAVRTLTNSLARFNDAAAGRSAGTLLVTPVDVLSWLVNEINNVDRNHRLDMAVSHASRIAAAQAIVDRFKKAE